MVVWGRGATTVLIATRYVPAIVSDTSNAFFRLSSPGSPVGRLTKEETETQKITYLAPEKDLRCKHSFTWFQIPALK